jgi:hypothetical protein
VVGIVEAASPDIGVRVALKNSSDPCVLPPDLNAIRRAAPRGIPLERVRRNYQRSGFPNNMDLCGRGRGNLTTH